jgi:hypothetical protein
MHKVPTHQRALAEIKQTRHPPSSPLWNDDVDRRGYNTSLSIDQSCRNSKSLLCSAGLWVPARAAPGSLRELVSVRHMIHRTLSSADCPLYRVAAAPLFFSLSPSFHLTGPYIPKRGSCLPYSLSLYPFIISFIIVPSSWKWSSSSSFTMSPIE